MAGLGLVRDEPLTPREQELLLEWRPLYEKWSDEPLLADADFESLTIGWCMAHGLTPEEGWRFSEKMVPLELF